MRHVSHAIFAPRRPMLICFLTVLFPLFYSMVGGAAQNVSNSAYDVAIEKRARALQGYYSSVNINLRSGRDRLDGFTFLLAYDTTQLRFKLAEPGALLNEWGWTDFAVDSFAVRRDGATDNLAFLRLSASAGSASVSNAAGESPGDLVKLVFFINDDPRLACRLLPIRFFWLACDDNVIFTGPDRTPHHARSIIDSKIPWADMYDLPGDCFLDIEQIPPVPEPCRDLGSDSIKQTVDFINGGIDITCAENSHILGDLDLNGIPGQLSDLSALAGLLIYGRFCPYASDSILTVCEEVPPSPVNPDGISLSSLVFLNRNTVGDWQKNLEPGNDSTVIAARLSRDSLTLTTLSSTRVGAMMLTFECDDDLTLKITGDTAFAARTCRAAHDGTLCLLVYWPGRNALPGGEQTLGTMSLPGVKKLSSAEAVDYYGRPLETSIARLIKR